jgi:hypothetical protein
VIGRGRSHGAKERPFRKNSILWADLTARVGLVASLLEHPTTIWQSGEEALVKHLIRVIKSFQS